MPMKKLFAKCIFLFMLLFAGSLYAQTIDTQSIKVGIFPEDDFTTIRIQCFSGNWRVEFGTASATREYLAEGEDCTIMLVPKGLVARFSDGKDFNVGYDKITLKGGDLLNLEIPDHQPMLLQGSLTVGHADAFINLVNTVTVHQHIVSSISKIGITNEPEALRAICTMARTRLAWLMANPQHKESPYDICDASHCMPFLGCGYNRELVDLLTSMTDGQIIRHAGKPIMPRYHNTCGGKISSARDVYGADEPYHQAKADLLDGKGSENCFHSPNFHWSIELQKVDVLDFLSMAFAGGADRMYNNWEPKKVDAGGRILEVTLRGKMPKSVSGTEFHKELAEFFGPNGIKSMKFTMEFLRRTIIFRGMGYGDGTGLCLYGADGLAKKSQKYLDIVKFYYPGTEVK
ncbi:MAG: hypothetical protein CVV41_09900 [Candidatus Riflebacteria bacterium HGW-Riflebacteria-1]|jgi:stage II sporulation protein D|nr:MAG: hypothetical protein CVV41_09900 [Candidatus Riflebacteria bacterium HGW-Riflebacteria-1]